MILMKNSVRETINWQYDLKLMIFMLNWDLKPSNDFLIVYSTSCSLELELILRCFMKRGPMRISKFI